MQERFEITVAVEKAVAAMGQLGTAIKGAFGGAKKVAQEAEDAFKGMSVDDVKKKIADLGAEIGKLSSRDDIKKKQAEIEQLNGKLNELMSDAKEMGSDAPGGGMFGAVFGGSFAAGLAAKGMDMVGGAIGEIKSAMIDGNAEMEQYQAKFETMLGSAEAANDIMADLKKFGAETPFEFPGLAQNATLLKSFGTATADILPTLQMLGDVSGGSQEKLNGLALVFAQVQSAGKLQGGDLMQLINQGFNPLQQISERTGKSMGVLKEEMSKGLITFDMVKQAFADATASGGQFEGMMAKQAGTFTGMKSTLSDTFGEIGRTLGKPLFDASKEGIGKLLEILGDPAVMKFITALGKAMTTIAPVALAGAAAFGLYTLATNAAAIASWALNSAVIQSAKAILANPIALAVAATAAAVALAVKAINDMKTAASDLAQSTLEATKAEQEYNKSQQKSNQERQTAVTRSQAMMKTYTELGDKQNLSREENERLREAMVGLNSEYPGLIKSGDDFRDNLERISMKGSDLQKEMAKLQQEYKNLQQTQAMLSMEAAADQVDVFREKILLAVDDIDDDFTDSFKNALRGLSNAVTASEINAANAKVATLIGQLGATATAAQKVELRSALAEMTKAQEDYIFRTENKGKSRADIEAEAKAAEAAEAKKKSDAEAERKAREAEEAKRQKIRDEKFKAESADLKREEDRFKVEAKLLGESQETITAMTEYYAGLRLAAARKYNQDKETIRQLEHEAGMVALNEQARQADESVRIEEDKRKRLAAAVAKYEDYLDKKEKDAKERQRKRDDSDRKEAQKKEEEANKEKRQSFEDDYAKPVAELGVELAKSVFDSQITSAERLQMLYSGLGNIALDVLSKMATEALTNMIMGAATQAGIVAASAAEGAALLGVWGPLAAAVSAATFGANSAPAIAGMGATSAAASVLFAPKMFAAGGIADRPIFTAIAGERGPEVIAPLDQLPGLIRTALSPPQRGINKRRERQTLDVNAGLTIDALHRANHRAARRTGMTQR